jgi:folate-binding Fe-S cluster repair protein YgfZ
LDGSDLPKPGAEVRAGNMALGEITSVYGPQGFALIRLDRCEEAGEADMRAGETGIRLDRPAWLSRAEPT